MKTILIVLGAIIILFVLFIGGYMFYKIVNRIYDAMDEWFDQMDRTKEAKEIYNFKKKI